MAAQNRYTRPRSAEFTRWPRPKYAGLRKDELLRHVGLYGSSGSGKSNAIALILDGLNTLGTPFLLCDFKRTFRALLLNQPDLLVFTAGDSHTAPFRINALIPPPGTSVDVWAKKVIGALSHAYCQGAGSESLLITALTSAYSEAAAAGRWPTFQDVGRILDEQPARGRKGMWMDSARRSVTSVTAGNAGDVFCPECPTDLTELLRGPVVLELDLLNQAEQTFLSEVLILWIIQYRMNDNVARETLRHAIVIEEAHHLLRSPPGVGDGSDPVIHIALREVRELGESVILATQNASVVPVAVFGNQATTLAFHTKHQRDIASTSQAMLLKDEAKDELGRLPVGEAIVRVPRWTDPIHIRVRHRPIDKGMVTDQDIREHMANRACSTNTGAFRPALPESTALGAVPRAEDKQVIPMESPSSQAHSVKTKYASPTTTPDKENGKKGLFQEPSQVEVDMLADIVERPFDGVVQRIRRLGASRRKGTAALKALEMRNLVKAATFYTGSAMIKLFDLTSLGRSLCFRLHLGPLPDVTEGGIEHRFWIHHVDTVLRSSQWLTQNEYAVSTDTTIDIHAQKGERIVAILVETGASNIIRNVERAVQAGYREIWVVSNNPSVLSLKNGRLREAASKARLVFKAPDAL